MLDSLRGTGRTTRMLQEASRYESEGKRVFVVAAHHGHAIFIRDMLPKGTTINVISPESRDSFDWDTLSIRGTRDSICLVDHYAIEAHFTPLIEMFHRYDTTAKTSILPLPRRP